MELADGVQTEKRTGVHRRKLTARARGTVVGAHGSAVAAAHSELGAKKSLGESDRMTVDGDTAPPRCCCCLRYTTERAERLEWALMRIGCSSCFVFADWLSA
jgi:hypothetical protein